jgi:hypothetical protein
LPSAAKQIIDLGIIFGAVQVEITDVEILVRDISGSPNQK